MDMTELFQRNPWLANKLKQHRPTYSDTPGMGNRESWMMQGMGYPEQWTDQHWQDKQWTMQQLLQKKDMQLPLQERYGLEALMLDKYLSDQDRKRRIREFEGIHGNRGRLYPHNDHSYRQETGDEHMNMMMRLYRKGFKEM